MQRQANLKSIIKCIHSCLFEVLFALIHLKNAALSKYVQTCKTWIPWNWGSRLQVWMDNVPSDVLIEDLIAWLAWPAHNRAYLIPRPFIRHRLHWSLYNYIMYLGQESSILYFIYWVQLLIKKGIGNTALFYAHLKILSHQIWCYWEIFDYLLGLRCCLYLQHISSQTVKVSVLQFILKKNIYIA